MTRYVYIAGRLSGDPPTYLANVHEFCATSRILMDLGYCPINPAADALEGIMSGTVMGKDKYQTRSMDLLGLLAGQDACVLVIGQYHRDGTESTGTAHEIAEADRLGIPVVYGLGSLP